MKRCFLALTVLLGGAVSMASADYILIKVNVGQPKEPAVPGAGAIGVVPGGTGGATTPSIGPMGIVLAPRSAKGSPPPWAAA